MLPRIFISYSHDSDGHKTRLRELAEQLRADGVTVVIDQDMLPGGPPNGWPKWSEAQVRDADLVLVACTESYCRRYESEETPGAGLGAVCEAQTIRHLLYEAGGFNEKFRVIIFSADDNSHVPMQLASYHRFLLPAAYDELLAWVRGPGSVEAPSFPLHRAISWPSPASDYTWRLANRDTEFVLFRRMISGQLPQRILLVKGATNTGKTALLAELMVYARLLKLPATLLDLKGCPSLDDLFQTLRLDLGQEILRHSYSASGTDRFYHLISDFQQHTMPLLLIFDTYEQASEDAQKWLESQLLQRLDRAPGVVVLIGGQQIPDYTKYSWRALTEFRELLPIQQVEDWLEYSKSRWQCPHVTSAHVEALTLATGGDPGTLSALLENMVKEFQGNSSI